MHVAALIQREIEVTGILRLSIPLASTQRAARQSFFLLMGVTLLIVSGVSLVGWVLANNLARPIQILTQAARIWKAAI